MYIYTHRCAQAGGQNLTGPTAVVLNTTSEDPQGQTRNDQVLLMSIPGAARVARHPARWLQTSGPQTCMLMLAAFV